MGNLGMPELIFILVLALIIFGPKKLPEIGKQVGKALGEFKRASNDLKRTIEDEVEKVSRDESATAAPAPASPPLATAATAATEAVPAAPAGTVPSSTADPIKPA